MSLRIRGQEALVQVVVDGVLQEGSFFKVKDFRVTPRTDLVEEDYLGEQESDLDVQHHGLDGTFSVDNQDARTLAYLSNLIAREQAHVAPSEIGINVEYLYREFGNFDTRVEYSEIVMKVSEQSISGRKDYISTTFEWKAKKRFVAPAVL